MFKKFILSLILLFIGCGSYQEGGYELNPFNIEKINPYTDEYFNYAWHLQKVNAQMANEYNIAPNAHINIYKAWNDGILGSYIKVAIIDNNFATSNPDIAPNIIYTYNIETNSTNVYFNQEIHGTACASILAAAKNGIGTIGVAPQTKLILISGNVYKPYNDDSSKIKAFYKAKELGARVISCSWGTLHVSESVSEVIKEMYESNISVVFAAGNGDIYNNTGINLDRIDINDESELPTVIGVGALNQQNKKASYSNYGKNIDIYAPAGDYELGIIAATPSERYQYLRGTSAATPIVAGVIALILNANYSLTTPQIMQIIKESATITPDGLPKIDASKAVQKAMDFSTTSN